ncbi:DUF1801 domain-containing protein [Nonomuraea sp. NPDC049421]|uniref:iron chaperone n=1 Tax=Nonomuraea sp. NPDC049421 TaxID=3155275 RepID=UPI003416E60F
MATKSTTGYEGFTEEERAAMKEHAQELKKTARRGSKAKADGEADVLAKIAEFPEGDRELAERIHAIVKENAPHLTSKLWYGQPAYARDGKVVCFFQPSSKFTTRYSTLGFNDAASLDDGVMWPSAYALTGLDAGTEERIAELVRRAAG